MNIMEKIKEYGVNESVISDSELLQIIIGDKEVAERVLAEMPRRNLYDLSESDVTDLSRIKGVGRQRASRLIAAVELGRRIARQKVKRTAPDFSSPDAIASYVMEDMRNWQQEHFAAVYLSTRNQLICWQTLSIGTINGSLAKAREVFRLALRNNAAQVVLLHNHPSGDPEPSQEDIAVTQHIVRAGDMMEIPVLDHIIIGDGIWVSLAQRGYV